MPPVEPADVRVDTAAASVRHLAGRIGPRPGTSPAFLRDAEQRDKSDPPSLFKAVQADTIALTAELMRTFGSAGKAW